MFSQILHLAIQPENCGSVGISARPFDGCDSIFDNNYLTHMGLYAGDGMYTKIHTLEIEDQCVTTKEVGDSFMHLSFPNIYKINTNRNDFQSKATSCLLIESQALTN